MLMSPFTFDILLCTAPVDMRKSIDGLCMVIVQRWDRNPASETIFVFCNRSRDKLKLLYWDANGFCLLYKRLEKGKFSFPISSQEVILNSSELRDLLAGLPFLKRPIKCLQKSVCYG
jgi:transposase